MQGVVPCQNHDEPSESGPTTANRADEDSYSHMPPWKTMKFMKFTAQTAALRIISAVWGWDKGPVCLYVLLPMGRQADLLRS